jgi:hypothetical protein
MQIVDEALTRSRRTRAAGELTAGKGAAEAAWRPQA